MTYTGMQSVLNASLGGYQTIGFRLSEDDDHVVTLHYQDKKIQIFSQSGATIVSIRASCQSYLDCIEGE